MLVSDRRDLVDRARFLATQAREPALHCQHETVGYNYRLSNLLAAVGRGQLRTLDERVARRRAVNAHYRQRLGDVPGISFMPEAFYGTCTFWLTCMQLDPSVVQVTPEALCHRLAALDIEARPVWKPLHLQPVFADCRRAGGEVAERLFQRGVCLPSGSALTQADLARVIDGVRAALR